MPSKAEPLFSIFGLNVGAEVITEWIIILIVAIIGLILRGKLKERPGVFQNMLETGIEYLQNFFGGILGKKKAIKYFTFLSSLFIFIIASNYSGLIPSVGILPFLKAPTSSLSTTLALGIVSFVGIQYYGIKEHRGRYFLRFIKPIAFIMPLLLLDEIIKPASLALRLFGNIFGEESVTEQLYHILPVGPPIIMMALSLLFCAIQAVVFTMLTSIYLDEAVEGPED